MIWHFTQASLLPYTNPNLGCASVSHLSPDFTSFLALQGSLSPSPTFFYLILAGFFCTLGPLHLLCPPSDMLRTQICTQRVLLTSGVPFLRSPSQRSLTWPLWVEVNTVLFECLLRLFLKVSCSLFACLLSVHPQENISSVVAFTLAKPPVQPFPRLSFDSPPPPRFQNPWPPSCSLISYWQPHPRPWIQLLWSPCMVSLLHQN